MTMVMSRSGASTRVLHLSAGVVAALGIAVLAACSQPSVEGTGEVVEMWTDGPDFESVESLLGETDEVIVVEISGPGEGIWDYRDCCRFG